MITYKYKITKFNINPSTKILTSVDWWYVGEENGNKYEIFNTSIFDRPGEALIPLDKISEKDVIKFIEKDLNKDYVKSMKKIIKEEIEKQKNPETVSIDPPWIENV